MLTLRRIFICLILSVTGLVAFVPTEEGLYAVFDTSAGEFVIELYYAEAPVNVAHFVQLAEGTQGLINYETGELEARPYFQGKAFNWIRPGALIAFDHALPYRLPVEVSASARSLQYGSVYSLPGYFTAFAEYRGFGISLRNNAELDYKVTVWGSIMAGEAVVAEMGTLPVSRVSLTDPPLYIPNEPGVGDAPPAGFGNFPPVDGIEVPEVVMGEPIEILDVTILRSGEAAENWDESAYAVPSYSAAESLEVGWTQYQVPLYPVGLVGEEVPMRSVQTVELRSPGSVAENKKFVLSYNLDGWYDFPDSYASNRFPLEAGYAQVRDGMVCLTVDDRSGFNYFVKAFDHSPYPLSFLMGRTLELFADDEGSEAEPVVVLTFTDLVNPQTGFQAVKVASSLAIDEDDFIYTAYEMTHGTRIELFISGETWAIDSVTLFFDESDPTVGEAVVSYGATFNVFDQPLPPKPDAERLRFKLNPAE